MGSPPANAYARVTRAAPEVASYAVVARGWTHDGPHPVVGCGPS